MANYKKKAANTVLLADKMRKSVLQAAIEGKLTTQNPAEDGDARDLLAEIQAEKQRLIAAGEIKREKALPAIDKNDLPFDIPNNWVWVRLGDIGETNIGLTYDKSDLSNEGTIVLRSGNIQKGKIDLSDVVRVKGDVPSSKMCHKGDLLICARNGSKNLVGKAAIIQNEGFSFGAFMAIFRSNLNEYIYYFLSSPLFRSDFDGISTTTINQITQSNLRERLIPLPPLAEQQRIISKLAQILPQLERLQADENKLHAMQTAFPSRMKASLLQAAIEGKLTTQDPKADGTASDLLKQIQTEKQRLIDAKEIKRERPLPAIVDEEKPFDIPDNWEWVRLSQIGEIISGGTPKTTNLKYWQNGDIPWITPADMKNVSKYISKGARNITKAGLTSSSARLMPKGSVLFSSRAPIGYVAIAENEISTNQGFKSIVPFNFNLSEYLYFALMALANDIAKLGTGTTFKEVSGATVSNILIPLPPLAEQERIVAKLDALLPKVQALNDL
jgi:type I restriction enzyme S subunit